MLDATSLKVRKRQTLLAAVAGALTLYGVPGAVSAQEQMIEEVTVTGIRGSLQRAQDVKRESIGVVDAIASEDLGKFPDQNVAESLQRITGVSIDRSGGEGQLITVRGLGPQFNAVLVNGRQIATENEGREFSFDTLAAELINGADVMKSPTANLQEGGIGATVNVKTHRPMDLDDTKISASVKGVYDDLTEEIAPQFSGLYSTVFADETMGFLVSLSHQERKAQDNLIETRYYRPGVSFTAQNGKEFNNVFVPQNYDVMVDEQDRTRTSGSAVFQFAPSESMMVTLDAMFSDFEVDSDTHAAGHWFSEGNFIDAEVDENNTVVFIDNANTGATDFIRRNYRRDISIRTYGLNIEWDVNEELVATFDASTSSADDSTGGKVPFTVVGYNNSYVWDNRGGGTPSIDIAGGDAALTDVTRGKIHYNERNGLDREDDINEMKLDFDWQPSSENIVSVKFGLYYQDREKKNTRLFASSCNLFCGYNADFPDELLSVYNASGFFGGVPNTWLTYDPEAFFSYLGTGGVPQLQALFDAAGIPANAAQQFADFGLDQPAPAADKFSVEEEIFSAYMDFTFEGTLGELGWQLNAGFRYSKTNSTLGGFSSQLVDLFVIPNDPSDLSDEFTQGADVSASNSYTNLLPSLNLRIDLAEDKQLRMSYSETLTRPTMNDLVPSTVVAVTRPNNFQAAGGNPDLKPFVSENWDISYEWYYGEGSYVAAAVFHKEVENFITDNILEEQIPVATYTSETYPDGFVVFDTLRPTNGDVATIDGLEVAWTHIWENGLGVQLNATVVDSDAVVDPDNISSNAALEGLGDSQNAVVFYEQGAFQGRIAFNNREGFLQEKINPLGGSEGLWTDTYGQWDISGSFDVNDNITVFFEGVNITGEETRRRGRFKNQLIRLEENGSRYSVGVRANF